MDLPSYPSCLIIKQSPVHGFGVFATEDLEPDTCLGFFTGTEYSLKDFKLKYGKDIRYCYHMNRVHKVICAKENRNWITYINESPCPNVILKKRACYTNRLIKAGEELFLQYDKNGSMKYKRDY